MKLILKENKVITLLFKEVKGKLLLNENEKKLIHNVFRMDDINEVEFEVVDSQGKFSEKILRSINKEIDELKNKIWEKVKEIKRKVKNYVFHLIQKLLISGDETCSKKKEIEKKMEEYISKFITYLENRFSDFFFISFYNKTEQESIYKIGLFRLEA